MTWLELKAKIEDALREEGIDVSQTKVDVEYIDVSMVIHDIAIDKSCLPASCSICVW